ncbi:hypothetical protein [Streptomyces endophytica]|uniref:Uncharacterized protein n=1 Tax=Streptomyces endophytica TaxID=2991496 RepID=A0ABY6PFR5_9ACTN|nr:hypothetical protein [Streptomyces endophytica]UZJ32729.1 hypothetical protein OJ254_23685 [Streptomyces endophytica]
MTDRHLTHAGEPLAELARRLRAADTGGWTEDGARALVESLGRRWDEVMGQTSASGAGARDAEAGELRLRPVGPAEERYVEKETYLELVASLTTTAPRADAAPEPDPVRQAEIFRAAKDELFDELGEPSAIGSYGSTGPYHAPTPAWGAPFLRWRGKQDTLELRAGRRGPELVLAPTAPGENWLWSLGHGEEHAISGYFGSRPGPANAGLSLPGRWSVRSWETLTDALAAFFTTLPAEFAALGIARVIPVYGRLGGSAPILFDIDADDRLMLASYAERDIDPASFGWGTVAEHPESRETWQNAYDPEWRFDAGGPGEPRGRALAEMVVATARAEGVASPEDLLIGGEGEDIRPYTVRFYGLGLATV